MHQWEDVAPLTAEERRVLLLAFRYPRGRYTARRASQLSGVPERTVYHWAHTEVLVSDYRAAKPKQWSYRDLAFLRLMAFLRSHGVDLGQATMTVQNFRRQLSYADVGEIQTKVSAAAGTVVIGDSIMEDPNGQVVFDTMVKAVGHFDLLADLGRGHVEVLSGPNLVRPSARTAISPWVQAGDPVVRNSRIPTAAIRELHRERYLNAEAILNLYPTLSHVDIEDALRFENRLTSV